jgi:hypothetical protein
LLFAITTVLLFVLGARGLGIWWTVFALLGGLGATGLWFVCKRNATAEVKAILADPGRCDAIRRHFMGELACNAGTPSHAGALSKRMNTAATGALDLFISHASEDKDAIARPLYEALTAAGISVWFDEATLTLGDSLRRKIDEGLATCRFGVVILSPHFLSKEWPQLELDGLVARETTSAEKAILPIWHEIDATTLARYSPTLAGRLAANSKQGVPKIVEQIRTVLGIPCAPVPNLTAPATSGSGGVNALLATLASIPPDSEACLSYIPLRRRPDGMPHEVKIRWVGIDAEANVVRFKCAIGNHGEKPYAVPIDDVGRPWCRDGTWHIRVSGYLDHEPLGPYRYVPGPQVAASRQAAMPASPSRTEAVDAGAAPRVSRSKTVSSTTREAIDHVSQAINRVVEEISEGRSLKEAVSPMTSWYLNVVEDTKDRYSQSFHEALLEFRAFTERLRSELANEDNLQARLSRLRMRRDQLSEAAQRELAAALPTPVPLSVVLEHASEQEISYFVARVLNQTEAQIVRWAVQLEMRPLLAISPNSNGAYIPNMSNKKRALFRMESPVPANRPLWHDESFPFKIPYKIDASNQGLRSATVRASAYVDGKLTSEQIKGVDEISPFFVPAAVTRREATEALLKRATLLSQDIPGAIEPMYRGGGSARVLRMSPLEERILLVLRQMADEINKVSSHTAAVAKEVGANETQVHEAINLLIRRGLLLDPYIEGTGNFVVTLA